MLIVGTKEKGEMGKLWGRGQNGERLGVSRQSVECVCDGGECCCARENCINTGTELSN